MIFPGKERSQEDIATLSEQVKDIFAAHLGSVEEVRRSKEEFNFEASKGYVPVAAGEDIVVGKLEADEQLFYRLMVFAVETNRLSEHSAPPIEAMFWDQVRIRHGRSNDDLGIREGKYIVKVPGPREGVLLRLGKWSRSLHQVGAIILLCHIANGDSDFFRYPSNLVAVSFIFVPLMVKCLKLLLGGTL